MCFPRQLLGSWTVTGKVMISTRMFCRMWLAFGRSVKKRLAKLQLTSTSDDVDVAKNVSRNQTTTFLLESVLLREHLSNKSENNSPRFPCVGPTYGCWTNSHITCQCPSTPKLYPKRNLFVKEPHAWVLMALFEPTFTGKALFFHGTSPKLR